MEEIIPLEPGKYYHIYNRGNNREDLFREEKNYFYFLQLWNSHIEPVAETYAYCLLKNHFHVLVRIREEPKSDSFNTSQVFETCEVLSPILLSSQLESIKTSQVFKTCEVLADANEFYNEKYISKQFSNLFNAYTRSFNNTYQRTGKLFQERFKRKPVTNEAYFTQLIQYIHTNPQKHGFVEDFRNWPHSSYHSHISEKPTRLMRGQVLRWFGGAEEYKSFHQSAVVGLEEWDV